MLECTHTFLEVLQGRIVAGVLRVLIRRAERTFIWSQKADRSLARCAPAFRQGCLKDVVTAGVDDEDLLVG